MTSERLGPGAVAARQQRALAAYVAGEVLPFSALYRARLATAGITRKRDFSAERFSRLLPISLDDLAVPGAPDGVLVPTAAALARSHLGRDWLGASLRGGRRRFVEEVVEPLYRPLQWHAHGGVPVASTADDLERLGDVGRRTLEHAGVRPLDTLVTAGGEGTDIGFWQVALGSREAGVAAVHFGPGAAAIDVATMNPHAVAGPRAEVARLLAEARAEALALPRLRTVIVVGDRLDNVSRRHLAADAVTVAGQDDLEALVVLNAWAPPGVRALWAECRQAKALHSWPEHELIEVIDPLTGVAVTGGSDGQLLWSGIGWRGTALLRLATGVSASLRTGACPGCGRTTPRLEAREVPLPVAQVLDRQPGIAGWQVELRTIDGVEELIVFLAPVRAEGLEPLLSELDAELAAVQYVVLGAEEIARRVDVAGGARVVDRRR